MARNTRNATRRAVTIDGAVVTTETMSKRAELLLPPATHKRAVTYARKQGISFNALVNTLIAKELERANNGQGNA